MTQYKPHLLCVLPDGRLMVTVQDGAGWKRVTIPLLSTKEMLVRLWDLIDPE